MRVSTQMIFNQSVYNVSRRHEEMYQSNEKVSTGKRVNRPSDDPVDAGKILGIRSLIDSVEQYKRNITTGTTWLSYTESSLGLAEQLFTDAKVLAEQMASGTYTGDQREMLATQAEQLYDQLVQVANTKVVDRYIFAGFSTGSTPFTHDSDYNVQYNGDDSSIRISIQQNTRVTINTTGQRAFISDTNVFDVLRDLRTALRDNDQDAIQRVLPQIDEAMNKIITERAYVGTAITQMEAAGQVLDQYSLATSEQLSAIEDTDMVEAVTQLKMQQIAYEATLKSTTMVTQLSLMQYM